MNEVKTGRGAPTGAARNLIQLANSSAAPILSLDAPSGLDTASGQLYDPHIHASATLTLALPKTGLLSEQGRAIVGDLYLADISVPSALYEQWGLQVGPIFAEDTIVKLEAAGLM